MPLHPSRSERLQRVIVHQLLRTDHSEVWSRSDLEATLSDTSPVDLRGALHALHDHNVIRLYGGECLDAASAARYLDHLEMISI